jgi:predicted GIY-YIG superfamily endonuclease
VVVSDYRVYVLKNLHGRHYVGISENLELRLRQHNAGLSKKWTGAHRPWEVVWQFGPLSLGEA